MGRDAGSNGLGPHRGELLVGPKEKSKGLKSISAFTKDAERLVVVDPYVYRGDKGTTPENYVQELVKAANIGGGTSLRALHIIYSPKPPPTKAIVGGVKCAGKARLRLTHHDTEEFHDRV